MIGIEVRVVVEAPGMHSASLPVRLLSSLPPVLLPFVFMFEHGAGAGL